MSCNRLSGETSPYLLQHSDNPVHWHPWDAAAFAEAERDNKPILLSVGYSACHWCHVMAHESFEDPETAAVMNELFVNIKVDREERPDLDAIYQSALALLGEHGGWPLTMFLTPKGEPFWGGTYFPPTGRYGRPGFRDVLRAVHRVFVDEPDKVERNRSGIATALESLSHKAAGDGIPPRLGDAIAGLLLRETDAENGGIGQAPKFPQVMVLELMWRAWCRGGSDALRDAVLLTARRMCEGGIYDHLGGGFARYATDSGWLVPHFEKMLYDNALLIDLLTQLWQETGEALFRTRVEETVAWALRDMTAPDGGFASAYDADSEGEEGRFYTWSIDEIDAVLGDDAAVFKAAYDITPAGNWEGRNILHRNHAGAAAVPDDARLTALREILFAARSRRVPPGRDDKVLADWNGLMIAALAGAGAVFDRPDWIAAARRTFDFVATRLSDGGRLRHSYRAGRLGVAAVLDDYANMARGALALYDATGDSAYPEQAEAWVAIADRHYWDDETGGYFFAADDAERLIVRTKSAADSAVPSGNATMVAVLARLHALTAKPDYRARAERIIAAFGHEAQQNPVALCGLVNANELLSAAVLVVVVGEADDAATRGLISAVFASNAPNRVLARIAPGSALPATHPAAGKGLVDGRAAAYVCAGQTCSLPLTDPAGLRAALAPR
ncbi:MAG: thioredoxin domain-containing protein [Alphaproteobacteria bacterium]